MALKGLVIAGPLAPSIMVKNRGSKVQASYSIVQRKLTYMHTISATDFRDVTILCGFQYKFSFGIVQWIPCHSVQSTYGIEIQYQSTC